MVYGEDKWQESAAMYAWLADVFYKAPTAEKLGYVASNINQWPVSSDAQRCIVESILSSIEHNGVDFIREDFNRLFIGPGKKEVYPWGSVYTDEEGLLFGPSTVAWELFCKQHSIEVQLDSNEPTDHFALIFSALSAVMQSGYDEKEKANIIDSIVNSHLMPWGEKVLHDVKRYARTDYFRGFSVLAIDLLTLQIHPNS